MVNLKYIFDTSAVILLLCDCDLYFPLLEFKKNNLYIPRKVFEECLDKKRSEKEINKVKEIFTIVDVKQNKELLPYFHGEISDGEYWVISYALNNDSFCCVIDEKFGSRLCDHLKLKKIGSVGIIIKLFKLNLISKPCLSIIEKKIRKSTFYFTEELLKELHRNR